MFRTLVAFLTMAFAISSCGGVDTTLTGNASGGSVMAASGSNDRSLDVRASRTFIAPDEFPPSGFAGYGVLAFPSHPSQNSERFQYFCQAFLTSISSSERVEAAGISLSSQMVTVLPVVSRSMASFLRSSTKEPRDICPFVERAYDVFQAQDAIQKAEKAAQRTDGVVLLDGRGPFLIAWSPGSSFNSTEALVLVADLSDSSTKEQIQSDMSQWRRDIESDPTKWRTGWNSETVRLTAQRWVDRRGAAILKLLGDWG